MSDLAARFRRLIAAHGPMPVAHFMGESNARYYASRDPLGAPKEAGPKEPSGGDFVTAPEISQIFGELVGLWLADVWDRAGRPSGPVYAELGPGRGTLASDALRAMAAGALRPAAHFVEGSPTLRALAARAVPDARFHADATGLPEDAPLLLVANEFLDALPIRQLVRAETGWRERMVSLADDRFIFAAGNQPVEVGFEGQVGTIVEICPGAAAIVEEIAGRLMRQGGTALFVDYGHLKPRTGSTLQAVRAHRHVDPLVHPGEADMTAHVDFAALADIASRAGCRVQTATQGNWLTAMGIDLRADALARAAPDHAAAITAAHARLVSGEQMGEMFKVMALSAPQWPAPAGFAGG